MCRSLCWMILLLKTPLSVQHRARLSILLACPVPTSLSQTSGYARRTEHRARETAPSSLIRWEPLRVRPHIETESHGQMPCSTMFVEIKCTLLDVSANSSCHSRSRRQDLCIWHGLIAAASACRLRNFTTSCYVEHDCGLIRGPSLAQTEKASCVSIWRAPGNLSMKH